MSRVGFVWAGLCGVLPLPPLPIAAIPLPDGMAAPLAAFGAVPVGLFG